MPKKEIEPRVYTKDVRVLLARHIRPLEEDEGESVAIVAEKADTSTRTIYRILSESTETLSLSLADRCLVAVGEHISDCKLKYRY
jgi:hypothetical protein